MTWKEFYHELPAAIVNAMMYEYINMMKRMASGREPTKPNVKAAIMDYIDVQVSIEKRLRGIDVD